MSITSAKSGATGISLALENNFMEPIASTLVGSGGANTVIFNDIPQTYRHLQIRFLARTNRADNTDNVKLAYNSDISTSNYTYHEIGGDGSGTYVYGSGAPERNAFSMSSAANVNANIFGVGIADILDYANINKYKTHRNLGGSDANGSGRFALVSGLWLSTSAITSITLTPSNGTLFSQYSRFSLYGIKG